jgi:hypothetical protein
MKNKEVCSINRAAIHQGKWFSMMEFNQIMQGFSKGFIGYKSGTSCFIVFNEQNGSILEEAAI